MTWNCTACTFLNEDTAQTCSICSTPRTGGATDNEAEQRSLLESIKHDRRSNEDEELQRAIQASLQQMSSNEKQDEPKTMDIEEPSEPKEAKIKSEAPAGDDVWSDDDMEEEEVLGKDEEPRIDAGKDPLAPPMIAKQSSWGSDWGGTDDGADADEWDDEIANVDGDIPDLSIMEPVDLVKENPYLELYWFCGRCEGPKNHPSRALCMVCGAPNMDNVMNIIIAGKSRQCPKCKCEIAEDLFSFHIEWCQPLKSDEDFDDWAVDLSQNAKDAMICVHEKGKKNHDANCKTLQKKLDKLGKGALGYELLLTFFEWHVPVIIQVFPKKLVHLLLKDPYYRNQFETKTSHGSTDLRARSGWETRMFDGIYDKAKPTERVKYGCLNMNMSPQGCSAAFGYGDAHFRLNDATTRWRVTITSADSSVSSCKAGTLKYATEVLVLLPDPELTALCECVEVFQQKKKEREKSKFQYTCYREAQIHGPISMARDIAEFHVPKKYKDMTKELEAFCKIYKIQLTWF